METGATTRAEWISYAERIALPVLDRLAHGRLKAELPVEAHCPESCLPFTQLEIVARTLVGIAPWLELAITSREPQAVVLTDRACTGLKLAADVKSADAFNFISGLQPLVDAAFLAQALLRAPNALWHQLDSTTQDRLAIGFQATRSIAPYDNNWWLFAALIEVFLNSIGRERDEQRMDIALHKHGEWYLGDGIWGDGPKYHWNYYNSYVIQPMLTDIFAMIGHESRWGKFAAETQARVQRYAAIQERLVAADGSFPAFGRSLAYRCGAFQLLAQSALLRRLPACLPPAQVRRALTLVIRRTLSARDTFDPEGWLRIGLCGHQPALAERYISTASLYLCTTVFLPLGLPASDDFWAAPEQPTTWEQIWSGSDMGADQAYRDQ